jgi:UDP-N-acetylenolpyruvoylglucosamine reductase
MPAAAPAPPTVARETRGPADALAARLSSGALVRADEPLAKRTTLRVGGPADVYVEPASEADLAATLRFCAERGLKFFILGRGSNLLVRDGGFRGVVICLAQPEFSRVKVDGERLRCGAGAKLKLVANEAKRHTLAGLEFLEGIPGSVGGALRMNAGAMGGRTFDVVESVRVMDFVCTVGELRRAEVPVEYRCCPLFLDHIALVAVFRGQPGDRAEIDRRQNEFNRLRWEVQPAAPSAGCIFKNPAAIPAGKLIDELGLKGTRVGGAMVSLEHANFIVNDGAATAADMLALMEIIRTKARSERGVELETEVEIVGDPWNPERRTQSDTGNQ